MDLFGTIILILHEKYALHRSGKTGAAGSRGGGELLGVQFLTMEDWR
jgi:hypothetical protein